MFRFLNSRIHRRGLPRCEKSRQRDPNRVALAVYTLCQTRYMFPVLPELAIVPILHGEAKDVVPVQQKPVWGQSFGNLVD